MGEPTTLVRKLGIKPGYRVLVTGEVIAEVEELRTQTGGEFDVAVAFCLRVSEVEIAFRTLTPAMSLAGGLWIAWPKKASKVPTDCSDSIVRSMGLECGLVDNKVCSIDDVWSALRFVRRLRDR